MECGGESLRHENRIDQVLKSGFASGLRLTLTLTPLSLPFTSSNSPSNSNPIAKPNPLQFPLSMSLKPSNSSQNLMLPVSDPPSNQNDYADDKLFRGSAMTKRGAFAAASYMSCAGAFLPNSAPFSHRQFFNCFLNSLYPLSCVVLLVMFNKAALSSYNFPSANVITLLQVLCLHPPDFLSAL